MPRIDCCYACLPGGPFTPPPCRRCNSTAYFSQGLCEICHPGSPKHPGSCRDCLAWGVLREHNWRCWSCRGWRGRHPVETCPYCGQQLPLGPDGACRLCWKNAEHARAIGEPLDLAAANQHGQQLFLANLHYQPRGRRTPTSHGDARRATSASRNPPSAVTVETYQLALLPTPRPILRSTTVLPKPSDTSLAGHCDRVLREHAARHGWSKRLTNLVAASLRAVLAWQDNPGGPIKTSEAQRLLRQPDRTTVESTLEVLAAAGLLDDDRADSARAAFLATIAGLPATMTAQLQTWYTIMAEGSRQPPRRRPRHPRTIGIHVNAMRPILRTWAEHGHNSLAEITRADVTAALPTDPVARPLAGTALRCLFSILKARKAIFANPTVGLSFGTKPSNLPLPLDASVIRDGLNSPDPARALAVALVAFHGLLADQVRSIALTDVRDGRLTIDDRTIPLAGPVQVRLRAYLDHRARRFPNTANPYLLVNRRSAPRLTPVARRYPWHRLELQPRPLREDRILHKVFATGGDVRQVCALFGLSVNAAMRYTLTLEHPDLQADAPAHD